MWLPPFRHLPFAGSAKGRACCSSLAFDFHFAGFVVHDDVIVVVGDLELGADLAADSTAASRERLVMGI
jgi:hypothetical protein